MPNLTTLELSTSIAGSLKLVALDTEDETVLKGGLQVQRDGISELIRICPRLCLVVARCFTLVIKETEVDFSGAVNMETEDLVEGMAHGRQWRVYPQLNTIGTNN